MKFEKKYKLFGKIYDINELIKLLNILSIKNDKQDTNIYIILVKNIIDNTNILIRRINNKYYFIN